MAQTINVKIPYKAHPGQQLVHDSAARFKVLDCGRRWGKDRCSLNETARMAFKMAQEPRPRSLVPKVHVWSVAPSFAMLRQTWNELRAFWMPTGLVARKDEAELILEFKNGVYWELKSADKPDSLVSAGLDVLHMTEAARIKKEAYTENIRPMLSSPMRGPKMRGQGLANFNSTPRGRNWFYKDLWLKGQRTIRDRGTGLHVPNPAYDPDWESWQFPTVSNPHINPDEVQTAKKELPLAVYLQEYEAQFLEDAAGVFANVGGAQRGEIEEPIPGRRYGCGVDVAYQQDYTVITIMDAERQHVVYWERLQEPLWPVQEAAICAAAKKYNAAPIAVDRTGVGETAPQFLQTALGWDHRVAGIFFTADEKDRLVTQLVLDFQREAISYPEELEVLTDELLSYEYTYTKSGRFRYSAPPGQHDDCVMSLALAREACNLGPYTVSDRAY
jgi:hypothetical protein